MAYDRLVMIDDCAEGDILTFRCGRTISGGFLVGFSSGTDLFSSGGNFGGYAYTKLYVDAGSVGSANFIGIALTNGSAGDPIAVKMNGIFVLPSAGAGCTGGMPVQVVGQTGSPNVENIGSSSAVVQFPIGRALSTATATTGFALVRLW
jgi:hypothetical protein